MGKIATILSILLGVAVAAIAKMPRTAAPEVAQTPYVPAPYTPAPYVPTPSPAPAPVDPVPDDWWTAPIETSLCPCGCRDTGKCDCHDCRQRTGIPCPCGCEATGKCQCKNCNDRTATWFHDYGKALVMSKAARKPMLMVIHTRSVLCMPCKRLDITLTQVDLSKFVKVVVDAEDVPNVVRAFSLSQYPTMLISDGNGDYVDTVVGAVDAPSIRRFLEMKPRRTAAPVQHYSAPACNH